MICERTGKEIFMTKLLAMEVVLRNKNRRKNAKKVRGFKSKLRIHESPEIPYKCSECGYWHISGVRQINKRKQGGK